MSETIAGSILAVITTTKERVAGGAPIFFADTEEELQFLAFNLEKIMDATAHELTPSIFIMVRH